MKIAVFSTKDYEKIYLTQANQNQHELKFIPDKLSEQIVHQAAGCDAICCFVTDNLQEPVIAELAKLRIKLIALRSAGYDHVDLSAAKKYNISVTRAPKYSPEAVAEFAVGLILVLSRKILRAYLEGQRYNFSLEGLMGFNLHGRTVGVIGTGNIGTAFAKIMHGFGCRLLACDPFPNAVCKQLGVNYVTLEQLLSESDIVSLHCPLNKETFHIIDRTALHKIKPEAMVINTGRGALIDTKALLDVLVAGKLGYVGLDVYEKEQGLFFEDHHGQVLQDEQFLKLQSLPNVIITPHQAFFTEEAVINIAKTVIATFTEFAQGKLINQI